MTVMDFAIGLAQAWKLKSLGDQYNIDLIGRGLRQHINIDPSKWGDDMFSLGPVYPGNARIDRSAWIHPDTEIGQRVKIGQNVKITAPAIIGDKAELYAGTCVTKPVTIGAGAQVNARNLTDDVLKGERFINGWSEQFRPLRRV